MMLNRIVFFTLLAVFVVKCLVVFNWYIDDGFVSQTVARTLAETGVFSYAPEDGPQFLASNFLWVMILLIPNWLGLNSYLFEKIITIFFAIGVLGLLFKHLPSTREKVEKFDFGKLIPISVLSMSWGYSLWTIGGLETVFFSFIILLSSILGYQLLTGKTQKSYYFCILLGISPMIRPEATGVVGIYGLFFLFSFVLNTKMDLKFVGLLKLAVTILVSLAVSFLLMKLVAGSYIPSTAYIKAGNLTFDKIKKGFFYTEIFLNQTSYIVFILSLIGAVIAIWRYFIKQDIKYTLYAIASFTWILYWLCFIIPVGGDWMLGNRFFVHVLPLIAISLGSLVYFLSQVVAESHSVRLGCIIITLCFIPFFSELRSMEKLKNNLNTAFLVRPLMFQMPANQPGYPENSFEMAKFLNENCQHGELITITEAGFIPFYSKCRTFDLHGWSRRELAMIRYKNKKWEHEEFLRKALSYNPTYVILSGYLLASGDYTPRLKFEKLVKNDEEFQERYELIKVFENIREPYRYYKNRESILSYFIYKQNQ